MDNLFEMVFGFVDSEPIDINFESLGYESTVVTNNLGSLYLILAYQYTVFFVAIIASLFGSKCSKFNNFLNRKGVKWNLIVGSLLDNYFVLMITAVIGIENLKYGFNTPVIPINISNIFTVGHLSLCGIMIIVMTILFIKVKNIRANFDRNDLSDE